MSISSFSNIKKCNKVGIVVNQTWTDYGNNNNREWQAKKIYETQIEEKSLKTAEKFQFWFSSFKDEILVEIDEVHKKFLH